jgi:S1/P1 Nuclease
MQACISIKGRGPAAIALFASLAFIASSSKVLAWGYDCHRIIAEIAEQFLEPQTAHQVRTLLTIDNVTTLADVSTWADEIRIQHPETAPWHYVNIPIHPSPGEAEGYVAARDCPRDDCIVAKIAQFDLVLADRQASERQRLEALKYLVHFVGDIHQPLHVSDNNDRGGNDVIVIFRGYPTNVHAVWDTGIIELALGPDERSYALKLVQDITAHSDEVGRGFRAKAAACTD